MAIKFTFFYKCKYYSYINKALTLSKGYYFELRCLITSADAYSPNNAGIYDAVP